jgi:hypothetical protein
MDKNVSIDNAAVDDESIGLELPLKTWFPDGTRLPYELVNFQGGTLSFTGNKEDGYALSWQGHENYWCTIVPHFTKNADGTYTLTDTTKKWYIEVHIPLAGATVTHPAEKKLTVHLEAAEPEPPPETADLGDPGDPGTFTAEADIPDSSAGKAHQRPRRPRRS